MSYKNPAIGVILIIILIIALPINILLIVVLVKNLKKKQLNGKIDYVMSDRILVSLFLTSLLQTVFSYPIVISIAFGGNNEYSCNITTFPVFALANANIMHIVFLSIHRIVLCSYPLLARRLNYNFKASVLICTTAWLLGVIIALPPLFGWSSYSRINDTCTVNWKGQSNTNYIYIAFCFSISFILPVVVLILNFKNVGYLQNHSATIKKSFNLARNSNILCTTSFAAASQITVEKENCQTVAKNKKIKCTVRTDVSEVQKCRKATLYRYSCILMMVAFVGVWLPYACISIMATFDVTIDPKLYGYASVFGKSSALVIPLAHASVYRKRYKLSIFKLFRE